MNTEIGAYRGIPTQAVIDDNYNQFVDLLPKAIHCYLLSFGPGAKIHPVGINDQVQAGMRDRFACRSFASGKDQYDEFSHSYKWWCEGWTAMDKTIAATLAATPAAKSGCKP